MTAARIIELALALAIIGFGVVLYRRRAAGDRYGSQGAVLLFAIGAIVAVHGLGLMDYHPSSSGEDMPRQVLR